MDNNPVQKESRVVLVVLGTLFVCFCLTLVALVFVVTTQGPEISNEIQTQIAPRTVPVFATQDALATRANNAIARQTEQANLPLVLNETFDSETNDWNISDFDDDWMSNRERITDGILRIESTAKKAYFDSRYPHSKSVEDFYASVDAQQIAGSSADHYGITFRATGNQNLYWFGINGNQYYAVHMKYKGEWKTIIASRDSSAIQRDGVNRLAVSGQGSHFDLFINNTYVDSFEDKTITNGTIGIGWELEPEEKTTLQFDNLVVRADATRAELEATARTTELAPTLAARAKWDLVLSDSFDQSSNPNQWYIGDVKSARAEGSRKITNGTYRWQLNALEGNTSYSIPQSGRTDKFYLAVDVHKLDGPSTSFPCAVFRLQDAQDYYRFCINDKQEFKISLTYKNLWMTLVNWRHANAIRVGDVNRLLVTGEKSQFMFAVNGQYVWNLEDYRLDSGFSGVSTELSKGDNATFEFDNFDLRGSAPVTPTPAPTSTPNPAQVQSEATVQAIKATLTANDNLHVALLDTFDDNYNGWSINNALGKEQRTNTKILDGVYAWSIQSAFDDVKWLALPNTATVEDSYIAVRVTQNFGPSDIYYGLLLRHEDEKNFYAFMMSHEGRYVLEREQDGQAKILAHGTAQLNPSIQSHTLQALVNGNHIALAVDETIVEQLDDVAIPRGQVGLVVNANHGDNGAIQFDEFELRTP